MLRFLSEGSVVRLDWSFDGAVVGPDVSFEGAVVVSFKVATVASFEVAVVASFERAAVASFEGAVVGSDASFEGASRFFEGPSETESFFSFSHTLYSSSPGTS